MAVVDYVVAVAWAKRVPYARQRYHVRPYYPCDLNPWVLQDPLADQFVMNLMRSDDPASVALAVFYLVVMALAVVAVFYFDRNKK